MNWEQTILEVRANPAYEDLVREAYLGPNLEENVVRFSKSREFRETITELTSLAGNLEGKKMLDIGAGNGISAKKHKVEANVEVVEAWGESLPFADNTFDIVYGRQVMHHAHELSTFVSQGARVLRQGGVFMTTRDHVIKDDKDKVAFLERHPLHKYYGGENAFTLEEYSDAITDAGLTIMRSLDGADTAINYDPWGKKKVREKFGIVGAVPLLSDVLLYIVKLRLNRIPGRLHTFIALKSK